jgi:hypothetical protein
MPVQLDYISWAEFQNLAQRHIAGAELQRRIQFYVT